MKAQDPFCLYLKHQTRIYAGKIEPCCWFERKKNAYDINEVNEYKKFVTSIDQWTDECNHCWHLEYNDHESPRTRASKNPKIFGVTETTGPTDIVALEVQIDQECNSACIQCGPHNSTTWQKYQSTVTVDKSSFNKKIDLNSRLMTQKHIDMIKQSVDFSKLNQLVFLGGEPLLNDNHIQLVDEITKYKPLSTVGLRYITNGSCKPSDKTIKLWQQAKHVSLQVSLDGIGKHFNYHRWPLQWHQVEENIKFFRDIDLPNLKLGISPTVTPFNIFYFDQYLKWAEEFFQDHRSKLTGGFEKAFPAQGSEINLYSVPPELIDQIRTKYKDYPWLLATLEQFDPVYYKKFIDYINFHDQKRGINWKDYFPEIVKYFD